MKKILAVAIALIASTQIFGQWSTIDRTYDDMEDEVTVRTPYRTCDSYKDSDCKDMSVILYKCIKAGKVSYYLFLEAEGSTYTLSRRGVVIMFTDGTKWVRSSEKIDLDIKDGEYKYSAFVALTSTDLTTFKSKTISKFRLYIYDNYVGETEGQLFKALIPEVIKTK